LHVVNVLSKSQAHLGLEKQWLEKAFRQLRKGSMDQPLTTATLETSLMASHNDVLSLVTLGPGVAADQHLSSGVDQITIEGSDAW